MELLAIQNSGYEIQKPLYTYDPRKDGKVSAVGFINQGENSIAIIKYPGVEVILAVGEFHQITCPIYGYDITQYDIMQRPLNPDEGATLNLKISVQKYVEK